MSNCLEIEIRDAATVVRFSRPEMRNPLSINVLELLERVVDGIERERLIFCGSGGVFASGADLREIASIASIEEAKRFSRRGQSLMAKIAALECLTIAAIDGTCFGGALDLALACKRRIAEPHAKFSHPGVGLGIITGWGGTQRLPRLIGEARALEMFLTARRIDAQEALRFGLVDTVSDDALECALKATT